MNKRHLSLSLLWQLMKGTAVQLLFIIVLAGAASATNTNAQQVLDRRVTIQMPEQSIRTVLQQLGRTAEVRFTYGSALFSPTQKVALRATDQSLADVLDKLLKPLSIGYKVEGRQIILNRLSPETGKNELLPAVALSASEQVADITGTVTDENGAGLPGVSVVLKGSSRGSVTDADGRYRLAGPVADGSVLVFSFVGYQRQEVAVGGRSTVNVKMVVSDASLTEVVVVGYGAVQRKDLTGAVSSINTEEVKDLALTRIDQALLGRVAGVQVKPVSGEPGAAPQILIRGIGSISAGTAPLFVVDGYPTGNIETLNPNDIESFDILKDASATAIYGSRGANGVVIINTKRGKSGKTRFGFNTYAGWQQASKLPVMMNARETAQYYYDGVRNRNLDEGNSLDGPPNLWRRAVPQTILDVLEGRNTYDGEALNEVLRTAPQQQYQLTATGGTDKIKFALSGEYFNQDGIIINSSFKRYSFRANIDAQLSDRLSVKVNLNPSYTDKYDVSAAGSAGTSSSETIMGSAMVINNFYPLYNPDGSYFAFSNLDAQGNFQNPVAIAREILDREKRMRLLGNINLEYKLFDDLKLNVMLGANLFTAKGARFKPQNAVFFNDPPIGTDDAAMSLNWLTEYTLNYNRSFGKHNVAAVGGFTAQKDTYESNFLTSNKYPNNLVPSLSAASGIITNGSSSTSEWSLASYLARVNYNFNGKYYLTASIRTDGSSRFGANKKWGVFPSMAVAWRISDEPFLKSVSFLSELKLRTSYGKTGNNNIGNYDHIATINYEKYTLGGVAVGGYAAGRIANPNLTWETQQQVNVGIDASFFKRRLSLTVDHFQSRNVDLLLNVNIPDITGFSRALRNIGEVRNTGWEFTVSSLNIAKTIEWTTDFNISFYKNRVARLGPEGDPIYSGGNVTMVGQPIGMFYGWLTDGIFLSQAEVDRGPIYNPGAADHSRPGDTRFVDVSGANGVPDGKIDSFDKTVMGTPFPDFYYGMTNRISYRNLGLTVTLQGSQGNQVLSEARHYTANTRGRYRSLAVMNNYWKSEQDPGDGKTPRPNDAPTGNVRGQYSQRFLDDGSYLRISNVTLSYLIADKFSQKIGLNSVRVYATATNPAIFTKYLGFNPDVSNSSDPLRPGVDQNDYPLPKSLVFGLNIGF